MFAFADRITPLGQRDLQNVQKDFVRESRADTLAARSLCPSSSR